MGILIGSNGNPFKTDNNKILGIDLSSLGQGGSGSSVPDFMQVFTSGSRTYNSDTSTYYNSASGSGNIFVLTHIYEKVQEIGKTPVNCIAIVWDSTPTSSISTLVDNSFMYGAIMLNQSSPVYINSGFTDVVTMAYKTSSGTQVTSSTGGNFGYNSKNGNLIDEIGFPSGAYFRAGRTYSWICIAICE